MTTRPLRRPVSERQRIRLVGVDPKVLHRLGRLAGRQRAAAREGDHRRGSDMRRVDLEQRAQGLACVAAAEPVRAERDVVRRDHTFLKVEATKFTEVGYVGRDVNSIVRDLVEVGISLTRETRRKEVKAQAEKNAEERVLDALVGQGAQPATREAFRKRLRSNELNDKEIEIQVANRARSSPPLTFPAARWA